MDATVWTTHVLVVSYDVFTSFKYICINEEVSSMQEMTLNAIEIFKTGRGIGVNL